MPSIDMNKCRVGPRLTGFRLRHGRASAGRRAFSLAAAVLGAVLAAGPIAAPSAQAQLQIPGTQPVPPAEQGQPAAPQAPAPAPAVTPAQQFGDWSRRCTTRPPQQASPPKPGETEVCFLIQTVTDRNTQKPVLKATVGDFGPQRQRGAVITLPMGVPLVHGLTIAVDGKEVKRVPFQICLEGCSAFLTLDGPTVAAFKAGNEGAVTVNAGQPDAYTFPMSLKGFTAGYGSLD